MPEIGVAHGKNEKHVWRYTFQQYVVKFSRHRAETLGLKLSGKKKTKLAAKRRKCIKSRNAKNILENVKANNSGEADKPRVSLARENRLDTFLRKNRFQWPPNYCACCARARRECLTWGRCLALFRMISELRPEISNRTTRRQCQLQGNTKQTH